MVTLTYNALKPLGGWSSAGTRRGAHSAFQHPAVGGTELPVPI